MAKIMYTCRTFLRGLFLTGFAVILFFTWTQAASAHATLIEAIPSPDSHAPTAPAAVSLSFNERLEKELYYIKLLNKDKKYIRTDPALMSQDQRQLTLTLPELRDGLYTVTYKVISADGHPVAGAYVFTIGTAKAVGQTNESIHNHEHHQLSADLSVKQILMFISRIMYYLTLLCATGWVLWGVVHSLHSLSPFLATYRKVSLLLRSTLNLAIAAAIAFQIQDYIETFKWKEISSLLLGTNIGLSWGTSIILAVLGLSIVHRSRLLDIAWLILLLASEVWNGHAAAAEPLGLSATLDGVHLIAASVWCGGLLFALLLWRSDKPALFHFLPKFSKAALYSILVLIGTGAALTLLFLPDLQLIIETQWGKLLLMKTGLLLLVIGTGYTIRRRMKRRTEHTLGAWLRLDLVLMIAVVAIVGIFTYLNPLPMNEPVFWHEAKGNAHLMVRLNPNLPGEVNQFGIELWLPGEDGPPRNVAMFLNYLDDPAVHAIELPLQFIRSNTFEAYPDFMQYFYAAEGAYMPFPGDWEIEVRLIEADDDEAVFRQVVRNYSF